MTTRRTFSDLPGPCGIPLLGNALQLDPARLHRTLEGWADQYGSRYRFRLGRMPAVVLAEPGDVLGVLRDRPETFRRLGVMETVNRELGVGGVFSAEGDTWRRHRELVMQGFDRTQLRRFFPQLAAIARRLVKRWQPLAERGQPFDGRADLMRYTVDVTTNFVFGSDLNTLEKEEDALQGHIEKILPMINRRVNAPFPYWRFWKRRADREVELAVAAVREACTRFIAQSRMRLAGAGTAMAGETGDAAQPSNLLEGFVRAEEGSTGLGEPEIISNAITMLLAGEDTSAHTLAWIIDYLCRFPEAQQRVQ
jgi:cytochrome P450